MKFSPHNTDEERIAEEKKHDENTLTQPRAHIHRHGRPRSVNQTIQHRRPQRRAQRCQIPLRPRPGVTTSLPKQPQQAPRRNGHGC